MGRHRRGKNAVPGGNEMINTTARSTKNPQRTGYSPANGRKAPSWMAWTPLAAILWPLAYGAVRVWWAVSGAPSFGPLGSDLIVFTGWSAVGLCAAAAGVALALMLVPWHWQLLVTAWGVSAALLAACALLLLDVVGGLLPGLGVPFHPLAFVSRAGCLAGGILLGISAEAYRRRWHSDCLFCGRTGL